MSSKPVKDETDEIYRRDIPADSPEETKEGKYVLHKYGCLRRDYLKGYRRALYREYVKSGELEEYLIDFDKECMELVHFLVKEMAKREGVDEKLKMADQMKWVGLMNNFLACAEEFVLHEYVYV